MMNTCKRFRVIFVMSYTCCGLHNQAECFNFIRQSAPLQCCVEQNIDIEQKLCVRAYEYRRNRKEMIDYVNNGSYEIFNNVNMLRELLRCRDGTFRLSNNSFNAEDIEQLIDTFIRHNRQRKNIIH